MFVGFGVRLPSLGAEMADAGRFQDSGSIIITGKPGRVPHGAAERKALYDRALQVLV
ncbi:hypothetical protein D3C77_517360 [compost metagenome]